MDIHLIVFLIMTKILTIGGATFDLFAKAHSSELLQYEGKEFLAFEHGGKISIDSVHELLGGGANNMAVGLSRLGFDVSTSICIGKEMWGKNILQNLQTENVALEEIQYASEKTGFSLILNSKTGDRTVLNFPGANDHYVFLAPKNIPDWVMLNHLAGQSNTEMENIIQWILSIPSLFVAWNPGKEQLSQGVEAFSEFLRRVHILFVNKEEAQAIAGKKPIPALMQALYRLGPKKVIITDSTNGSYTSDRTACYFMKPYPIKPIARTGAGDAYASGVLSALIKGKDLQTAMKWGTANAGGVIQVVGAHQGLLREKTITSLIQKHKKTIPKIIKRNPFT